MQLRIHFMLFKHYRVRSRCSELGHCGPPSVLEYLSANFTGSHSIILSVYCLHNRVRYLAAFPIIFSCDSIIDSFRDSRVSPIHSKWAYNSWISTSAPRPDRSQFWTRTQGHPSIEEIRHPNHTSNWRFLHLLTLTYR